MLVLTHKILVLFSVLLCAACVSLPSNTDGSSLWNELAFWESESVSEAPAPKSSPIQSVSQTLSEDYVLGTGDKIRLTVFGEIDLSGDYEISSTGIVALPLIGNVQAKGTTITGFEAAVRNKLMQGYLRDPRVNAAVINYRPFFILGEVTSPASYPYVNGMTILNAVALAGGYTYRADKTGITITRSQKQPLDASEDMAIRPGDIVRVPQRFF